MKRFFTLIIVSLLLWGCTAPQPAVDSANERSQAVTPTSAPTATSEPLYEKFTMDVEEPAVKCSEFEPVGMLEPVEVRGWTQPDGGVFYIPVVENLGIFVTYDPVRELILTSVVDNDEHRSKEIAPTMGEINTIVEFVKTFQKGSKSLEVWLSLDALVCKKGDSSIMYIWTGNEMPPLPPEQKQFG